MKVAMMTGVIMLMLARRPFPASLQESRISGEVVGHRHLHISTRGSSHASWPMFPGAAQDE